MASSVLRRVFQRSTGIFISAPTCCGRRFLNGAAGCCNSAAKILRCCGGKLGGHRMMSTKGSDEPPWLMLLPSFEGDDMYYKFYSLAEEKVFSIEKRIRGESEAPDDDAEFVGSSHGWLVLFNRRNNDMFLSNPRSRRHLKLPPIDINLPDPEINLRNGRGSVSKVILSSSPDDEGCRAMMTFGPGNRLAFCLPGRSWRWTPIGEPFFRDPIYLPDQKLSYRHARVYEDLVYCNRRRVFTCMTQCEFDLESLDLRSEMENWYIRKPLMEDWNMGSPKLKDWDTSMEVWDVMQILSLRKASKSRKDKGKDTMSWIWENMDILKQQCIQIPHLVYAKQSDQLYLVMRFVMFMRDGKRLHSVPYSPTVGLSNSFHCKTFGFTVLKVNQNGYQVVDDLDGLALFVGINGSFAISTSDFPKLKPNSIYFTESKRVKTMYGFWDTGIFDYENKTLSPIITGDSPLIWFTPSST